MAVTKETRGQSLRDWVLVLIALAGLAASGIAGYTSVQTRFAVQQVQIETGKADAVKLDRRVTDNSTAVATQLADVQRGLASVSNSMNRMEGQLSVISGRVK